MAVKAHSGASRLISGLVVWLGFTLGLWRNFVVGVLYPGPEAVVDMLLWILVSFLVLWSVFRSSSFGQFLVRWAGNWPVLIFVLLAAASFFWSIDPAATLYYAILVVGSTLFASYLGIRRGLSGLSDLFATVFMVLLASSYVAGLWIPALGRMDMSPYDGAWRGIFWHRNYLGSTMALGSVLFLVRFLDGLSSQDRRLLWSGVLLAGSLGLVFLSRSATGLILAFFLCGLVLPIQAWIKWGRRLRRVHYMALGMAVLGSALLILFNLDPLLGLIGRNSTFTGRVPLWNYLLTEIVPGRPWLGHGFGALWVQDSFRMQTRDILGWGYQVNIGDNGFLDIVLHLGWVGLVALLLSLGLIGLRTLTFAVRERTLNGFFPVLFLIYALVTNMTLSYFLQVEAFVWIGLIAVLFLCTPSAAIEGK